MAKEYDYIIMNDGLVIKVLNKILNQSMKLYKQRGKYSRRNYQFKTNK